MSYAWSQMALSGACPDGWIQQSDNTCAAPSGTTTCPNGFKIVGSECWPATNTACRDILGTFYDPAEPDRCKKACPNGTAADAEHVCRPVSTGSVFTPLNIGIGIFAIALAVTASRGRKR